MTMLTESGVSWKHGAGWKQVTWSVITHCHVTSRHVQHVRLEHAHCWTGSASSVRRKCRVLRCISSARHVALRNMPSSHLALVGRSLHGMPSLPVSLRHLTRSNHVLCTRLAVQRRRQAAYVLTILSL